MSRRHRLYRLRRDPFDHPRATASRVACSATATTGCRSEADRDLSGRSLRSERHRPAPRTRRRHTTWCWPTATRTWTSAGCVTSRTCRCRAARSRRARSVIRRRCMRAPASIYAPSRRSSRASSPKGVGAAAHRRRTDVLRHLSRLSRSARQRRDGSRPTVGPDSPLAQAVRESMAAHLRAAAPAEGENPSTMFSDGTKRLRLPIADGTLCRHCHGFGK